MIRIITDSAADLEPAEYEKLNVTCIPLNVMFGEEEYQENVNLSKAKFYELLTATGQVPKTSQASPQILLDIFEDAKAKGDSAIYISLSSALSGTYQTALMSKNMVDCDDCYVLDSRNATGGQRMIVEYAARLRDEGKTAPQIIEAIKTMRERIVLFACMDTMEYLYKGGRISQTVYTIGSLANIKPIISVDLVGRVAVPAKAIGMRKGMDYLCKRLLTQQPDEHFPLYVMYTSNRSTGEALAQRFRAMGYEIPDERIVAVGAAIGAHVGPNACGMVYVSAEE